MVKLITIALLLFSVPVLAQKAGYDSLQARLQEIRMKHNTGNGKSDRQAQAVEPFTRVKVTNVTIENCDSCHWAYVRAASKLYQLYGGRTGIAKGDSIDVYSGFVYNGKRRYYIMQPAATNIKK